MVQYPPLTFVAQCRNLTEVLPCVVASCPVDPLRHIDLFIYWDLLRPGLGQKINIGGSYTFWAKYISS